MNYPRYGGSITPSPIGYPGLGMGPTQKTPMSLAFLLGIVIFILLVGIGLLIGFEVSYNHIIKNPSPLCLNQTCKGTTDECGTSPFKIENGTTVCKPTSIFVGQIPQTNTATA